MLIFICFDCQDDSRPANLADIDATIRAAASQTERPMTSLWLVDTTDSVDAWSDRLDPYALDSHGFLFIGTVGEPTNGMLPRRLWSWINSRTMV